MTGPDPSRWQAVCERDATQDGVFVFAVSTTGVYCRPHCPSRRARRENVIFFDTPIQAEAAGYRACKRCRPDEAARPRHADAVLRACRDIREAEEEPALALLAAGAGLSPGHFQRVFTAQVGLSPKRYAMAVRKQRLRDGLAGADTVTRAIYEAGYASASRAYADKASAGLTPGRYRRGAAGETLRYAIAATGLGDILVAATDRGVCLVEFLNPGQKPEALLADRFPGARLELADDGLGTWVAGVVARIDMPRESSPVPLDIRGTAFQEKVWRALTEIPVGETVSYTDLAASLGQPTAARAVATACAANRLAVVVPCHRVVRGTGDLAGYRWGLERKRALLKGEKRPSGEGRSGN